MRFFKLEPGYETPLDKAATEALRQVSEDLERVGARKAVLIVEDTNGVSITVGRSQGFRDDPKDTADLLLRVALDAKDVVS